MIKERLSLRNCLEIPSRKMQPGNFQKIVLSVILFDIHNFSSQFIISVVKMERGRNRSWIMEPQFLKSLMSCSNIRKLEEARTIRWSFRQYSFYYKIAALVVDACGTF